MNGYTILEKFDFEFENLKLLENGKDYKACDIDRSKTDNVRQVFGEHERAIVTPGQSIQVICESKKPHFAGSEYPELLIGTKHRVSSTKSDRQGVESDS